MTPLDELNLESFNYPTFFSDDLVKAKKKKPSMTAEETARISRIINLMHTMRTSRDQELDRWDDNIRRQQGEQDISNDEADELGKNNLRIPIEGAFVEHKTADDVATLSFPVVLPTTPGDTEYARDFQVVMDFVINNVLNLKKTLINMTYKHKNTLGDGILKTYWSKDIQTIRIPKDETENGDVVYKLENIIKYDDIKVEAFDPRNFVIDPIAYHSDKDISDARYCGFFSVYRYDDFISTFINKPGFKNIHLVVPGDISKNDAYETDQEEDAKNDNDIVEVYEHWDIVRDELVYLANGIEIRESAIPYWNPFSKEKVLPVSHFMGYMNASGFWNQSVIDRCKQLSEERQTMRRINIDAAKGYTHPWIVSGRPNDIDADEFIAGINSILEVEDISQVKQLNMAGNSGLPFSLESANQNDSIIVTGVDITGILGGGGETATQTLEKKESGIKITKFQGAVNDVNGFHRLYEQIKNLILQKYKQKDYKFIYGNNEKGERVFLDIRNKKKMFNRDYDIQIVANNQIPESREIRKLRNQETVQTIGGLIDANGQIPPVMHSSVKKLLIENLEIPEREVNESLKTSTPQEQPQQEDGLSQALASAQAEGLSVEGFEGGNFPQKGDQKKSVGPGVQEQIQTKIQNIIG